MAFLFLLIASLGLFNRSCDPSLPVHATLTSRPSTRVSLRPTGSTPGVAAATNSCAAPERDNVYEALNELFTCLVETHIDASESHRLAGRIKFGRLAGSGAVQPPLLTKLFSSASLATSRKSHQLYYELARLFPPEQTSSYSRNDTVDSAAKTAGIDSYLLHLESSPYIVDTYHTLRANDALPDDCGSLREFVRSVLYKHWFKPYGRQAKLHRLGVKGSSGFGHVFVGEVSSRGVTGFHSWLAILSAEESGVFEYKGYVKLVTEPLVLASLQFGWLGKQKPISSFAFGVDTEFQLALFSACFIVKPGRKTRLQIKEMPVAVQTFVVEHQPESIGSAYFVF